jgi:molecular chaperone GrpE
VEGPLEENKTVNPEKSQEEMVKEAVEEAKKAAAEAEANADETETEEVEAVEETEESSETEEKKGLFGKKNKKDKKDEKIEELTDKLIRQMAEFDNYRKRTEREKSQMYEIGARDIIEKILPVVDNFDRAMAAVKDEQKDDPFVQGMDKIYKHMMTTLEEIGVKPIEAVGKEFDLNLHNAVMHIEDENYGENIVVDEFQKGYTYRDSVVRHSMVRVAN